MVRFSDPFIDPDDEERLAPEMALPLVNKGLGTSSNSGGEFSIGVQRAQTSRMDTNNGRIGSEPTERGYNKSVTQA